MILMNSYMKMISIKLIIFYNYKRLYKFCEQIH